MLKDVSKAVCPFINVYTCISWATLQTSFNCNCFFILMVNKYKNLKRLDKSYASFKPRMTWLGGWKTSYFNLPYYCSFRNCLVWQPHLKHHKYTEHNPSFCFLLISNFPKNRKTNCLILPGKYIYKLESAVHHLGLIMEPEILFIYLA